jgi:hypothetical protein
LDRDILETGGKSKTIDSEWVTKVSSPTECNRRTGEGLGFSEGIAPSSLILVLKVFTLGFAEAAAATAYFAMVVLTWWCPIDFDADREYFLHLNWFTDPWGNLDKALGWGRTFDWGGTCDVGYLMILKFFRT